MAEPLGVAAGAFGIVSLSIQLAESVQKVRSFYAKVKNAPPELADLIEEIEEMSNLVKDLEHEHQSTGSVVSSSMQKCIKSSRKAVDYFEEFAVGLQNRTTKSRIRGGLKFALSQNDIGSMLNRLERSKSLLTLAYIQYQQAINQQQQDATRKIIEGLASGQSVILKAVQTADESENAEVSSNSKRPFYQQNCSRTKRVFKLETPTWLSKHIWQLALDSSISGWQFALRTYGVVSNDSEVMKACEAGDVVRMRKLFDAGLASPFDCTDQGTSLWAISLRNHHLDVIRFLLGCGATSVDKMVREPACLKASLIRLHIRIALTLRLDKQPYAIFWVFALLKNCTSKFQEDTLFLCENCDDADEEQSRIFFEWDAMRFASCPPERLASLILWQKMKYWCLPTWAEPSRVSDFTNHSDLLTQFQPADSWGMTQLQLLAVNLGFRVSLTGIDKSDHNTQVVEKILLAAINLGLDIHGGSNGHTPLMSYLSGVVAESHYWRSEHGLEALRTLKPILSVWLDVLHRAAVDLLAYGKEESRRFVEYQSSSHPVPPLEPWNFFSWIREGMDPRFALTYGSTPSEWDVELLDLKEEYAEEFWRMVDKQTEEDECRRHAVPGGWVDD